VDPSSYKTGLAAFWAVSRELERLGKWDKTYEIGCGYIFVLFLLKNGYQQKS
jgi:hypothetical protein